MEDFENVSVPTLFAARMGIILAALCPTITLSQWAEESYSGDVGSLPIAVGYNINSAPTGEGSFKKKKK